MRRMTLRLPKSLHRAVKDIAEREGISAHQFIILAVAEKVEALMTDEPMEPRAPDRARQEGSLREVPGVTLDPVARKGGEVRIERRDGSEFALRPVRSDASPLDVPGVDTDLTRDDIIAAIRESRERSPRQD